VTTADVFTFLKEQRSPRRGAKVVRLEDGEAGLAACTFARRLSSLSGLYVYLVVRGDAGVNANPVPRSLSARRPGTAQAKKGMTLIRTPRTLPRVLSPAEVDALFAALRTSRDRAMVLGGMRRCEVLGLDLGDIKAGERRVFISQEKEAIKGIQPR
jgi:integrase